MTPIIAIPGFSEPFSCWSHFFAAAAALVAGFFLIRRGRGNALRVTVLTIYTISLVFLFSMSGVYHLLAPGGAPRMVLQRLDHAGIWLVIMGTFLPIHILFFRGFWRWGILSLVWGLGLIGLILEIVFFSTIPEWLALSFFLGLGWLGLLTSFRCARSYGLRKIDYLVWGGLSYSLGAVAEFMRVPVVIPGIIGPHEVFHVMIIIGSALHWWFIYQHSDVPVVTKAVFLVRKRGSDRYIVVLRGERFVFAGRSPEEAHAKISAFVERRFHASVRPRTVWVHYTHEEKRLLFL